MSIKQSTTSLSKSQLFHYFNKARACGLSRERCNKALSYLQAGRARLLSDGSAAVTNEDGTTYRATAKGCTCADWLYRGSKSGEWCKHMVCFGILTRAQQQAPKPAPVPAPTISQQEVDDEIALLYGVA